LKNVNSGYLGGQGNNARPETTTAAVCFQDAKDVARRKLTEFLKPEKQIIRETPHLCAFAGK
jgi:hypothetical protein